MQNTPDTTRMTPIAAVQMVSTTDPLINMQRAAQRIGEAADGSREVLRCLIKTVEVVGEVTEGPLGEDGERTQTIGGTHATEKRG